MALDFTTQATESTDSTGFSLYDLTGDTAVGGWGVGGNPAIADVIDCSAAITKPDTTTLLPSVSPSFIITVDVFPTVPNDTSSAIVIPATDLGYSEIMQSGIYKVITTGSVDISGTETPFTDTTYMLVDNQIRCCIDNILLNVNLAECNNCLSKDSLAYKANLGLLYLNMATIAFSHADYNKAAKALIRAQEICDDCQSCNC